MAPKMQGELASDGELSFDDASKIIGCWNGLAKRAGTGIEGVDVSALDAVMFLHPRNSQVDVVQSVGRVMRKAPGKNYGYIILPNALNAGKEKDRQKTGKGLGLLAGHVGNTGDDAAGAESGEPGSDTGSEGTDTNRPADTTEQIALFSPADWQEAIYTRIVDKVGTRTYWEDWAADVADISQRQILRINAILDDAQKKTRRWSAASTPSSRAAQQPQRRHRARGCDLDALPAPHHQARL